MSAPIIITVPNNYLAVEDVDSKVVLEAASPAPAPSRKRRLDHLSWEEKMQRKKLKNRVAAQTSRDRKKAKMDEMEARIQEFMDRNERLMNEVESLKALNERLLSENASLRSNAAQSVAGARGPAESTPRRQEGPPPAVRAARLLLAMCLLSQTSSLTSSRTSTSTPCTSWPTNSSKRLMQAVQERLKISQCGSLESALKQIKWWGPQQSTWNPVKMES